MHKRARMAIALLFVLGFFATAPFVLLYTAGYRWNDRKGRVEKTGLIQVSTKPEGALIFLNGILQKKTTPAGFKRILPDDYTVRLEKQGYFSWEKTLEVRSGETAFAAEIVLMRDSLARLRTDGDFSATAFDESGRMFASLRDADDLTELGVTDAVTGVTSLFARLAKGTYEETRMSWSPDGSALLFTGKTAKGATHAFLYPVDAPQDVRAIHQDFPAGPLVVNWSTDGSRLSVVAPNGAFTADAATGDVTPESLVMDVHDVLVRDRTVWIVRQPEKGGDAVVERGPLGTLDEKSRVAALPPGEYRFLDGGGPAIVVSDPRRAKVSLLNPESGEVIGSYDATGVSWLAGSRDGRLLLWNEYEIAVVDMRTRERAVVTRLGETLHKCVWHPEGQAVLYATDSGIFAAELDVRDHRNVYPLVRHGGITDFAIADDDLLRFVGTVGTRKGFYEKEL
jgi:hypothetical protein